VRAVRLIKWAEAGAPAREADFEKSIYSELIAEQLMIIFTRRLLVVVGCGRGQPINSHIVCRPAATASPDPSCRRVRQNYHWRGQISFSKVLKVDSALAQACPDQLLPTMSAVTLGFRIFDNHNLKSTQPLHLCSRHAMLAEGLHMSKAPPPAQPKQCMYATTGSNIIN
jgi:hypothetical protein